MAVEFPACTANLVQLGYQAVMGVTDEMDAAELKVPRDCRGRLDPRDLLVIWALLV